MAISVLDVTLSGTQHFDGHKLPCARHLLRLAPFSRPVVFQPGGQVHVDQRPRRVVRIARVRDDDDVVARDVAMQDLAVKK